MNVLIAHCGKNIYGGAERVIVELAKYLANYKHEVVVVAKDIPSTVIYDLLTGGAHPIHATGYTDLRKQVQKHLGWADVTNIHNFPATLTTFPVRNRPTVWMCNEPAELFTNWKRKPIEAFNRWWVRNSRMGAVVADVNNAARFTRIYGLTPKIIPYGVDYEYWSQGTAKPSAGVLRLLQVGTLSPYKEQFASLHALVELVYCGIDATLTIAGSATDTQYYRELLLFKEHNLPDRIHFLGQQTREQVRDLYCNHDLLLHPVREQGGWLVPFEALCAGLPVIVTSYFPAAHSIEGFGLPIASSPGDLAPAIISLKDNYSRFTGSGREWIKEKMTWGKFGEEMLHAFEENIRA